MLLRILNRVLDQISGCQAQRVSITRSMMLQSAPLIADESTLVLDTFVQAKLIALFRLFDSDNELLILFVSYNSL